MITVRRLVSHRNVKIPSRDCDENHPDHADQWRFIVNSSKSFKLCMCSVERVPSSSAVIV